jgi:hypothetical protein
MKHLRWLILLLLSLALGQTGGLGPVGGPAISGTPVATHCAEWLNAVTLEDSGSGCGGGGGSGTVTSVALSDGSTVPIYTISGSPVTTSGTLAFTLNTQTPNFVLAGPATGSTAVEPTFRALVAADIPSISLTSGVSGTLQAAQFPALTGDCTTVAGALATTCTKTNGTAFGTFATANAATPPAIGGTTPAAISATTLGASGSFSLTNGSGLSAASWTTAGLAITGTAQTLTDTTGTGTIAAEYAMALPAYTIAATNTSVTITTLDELFVPAPIAGTHVTAGALYAIHTPGNIKVGGTGLFLATLFANSGFALTGTGGTINASAGTNTTLIGTGTTSGTVTIGGASNTTSVASATVTMPAIASSSAATTGTVCWTTSTGNLTVDTTLACLSSLGAWKKDIEPLDSGLAEVMQLRPVSYELKPEYDPEHLGRQVGLLAEDVEQIDKRLVGYGGDGQLRGVRYMQMAALLTKGEQDLQGEALAFKEQTARVLLRQQLEIYFLMAWCIVLSYLYWRKRS